MLLLPAACDRLIAGMPAPPAFGGGGCREAGHGGLCGVASEEGGLLPPPPPPLHLRWHTALLGAALLAQPGEGDPAGASSTGGGLGAEWVRHPRPRTWPGRAVGSIRPAPPREGGDDVRPAWPGAQGHGPGTAASQPDADSGPAWASLSRPACAWASDVGKAGSGGGGSVDVRRRSTAWEADASASRYLDGAAPGGASASPEPRPESPLLRFDSASSQAAYARLGPGRQPPTRRATAEPLLVVREPSPDGDAGVGLGARPAGTDPVAGSVAASQAFRRPADPAAGCSGGPRPAQGGGMRAAAWADAEGGPPPLQRARWSTGAVRAMACSSEGGMGLALVAAQPCAAAVTAADAATNGTQIRDCNSWREAARPGTAVEQNSVRRPEPAAPGTSTSARIDLYTEERQRLPRRRRPPPLRSKTVRRCLGGAFAAAADAARPPAGHAASADPGPYPAWMQRAPDQQDAATRSDRGWLPFASGLLAAAPPRQECGGVAGVPGKHAPTCNDAPGCSLAADRPPLKRGKDCWSGGGDDVDGRIKAWRAGEDSAGAATSQDPGAALEAALLDEGRGASGPAPGPHARLGHERTLGEVLRALGGAPLPEAAARAVAANAAVALAELHGDGLVHRALGPDALVLGDGACFDTARCPATRCGW